MSEGDCLDGLFAAILLRAGDDMVGGCLVVGIEAVEVLVIFQRRCGSISEIELAQVWQAFLGSTFHGITKAIRERSWKIPRKNESSDDDLVVTKSFKISRTTLRSVS